MIPADGQSRVRVAVLFGGPSSEHDVSCASAASIVQHLDRSRFEVTPVRVTRDSIWVIGKDDPDRGDLDAAAVIEMTSQDDLSLDRHHSIAAAVTMLKSMDVVFPAFHGRYGEDGTVQSFLEIVGVPYVGNGPAASAVGLDKQWTKTLLQAAGLTVAPAAVLLADEDLSESERQRIGLPAFVKPAREGSSIGVSKVDDWAQLEDALILARRSDRKVLIESTMVGREIDIAVLQHPDGRVVCGPPLEIRVEEGFFDYAAKYQGTGNALQLAGDLPAGVLERLQETAIRAFDALGCVGLARVDFFVLPGESQDEIVVNEVNTFPGFSARSQYPLIWASAGLPFPELLTLMLETALVTGRRDGPVADR